MLPCRLFSYAVNLKALPRYGVSEENEQLFLHHKFLFYCLGLDVIERSLCTVAYRSLHIEFIFVPCSYTVSAIC